MSKRKLLVGLAIVVAVVVCLSVWISRQKPNSVVRISTPDAALQDAAHTAQDKLPYFEQKLAEHDSGSAFAILGKFDTSAGPEYLWLRDPTYSEGTFEAYLDQKPMMFDARVGDRLTVSSANVFDWMIRRGKSIEGGFTIQALKTR